MEAITVTKTKPKTKKTGKKPDYILMDKNTKAVVFGFQTRAIQRMLDFDYICRREEPSVVVIVNPTRDGMHKCFWGTKEILIPMVKTLGSNKVTSRSRCNGKLCKFQISICYKQRST